MRTLQFTEEELEIIREDIDTSLEYLDVQLLSELGARGTAEEHEQAVRDAQACRSILAKIDGSKHWLK